MAGTAGLPKAREGVGGRVVARRREAWIARMQSIVSPADALEGETGVIWSGKRGLRSTEFVEC